MLETIKIIIKKLLVYSLKSSRRENGYINFIKKLESVLPTLKDQSNFFNDDKKEDCEYLQYKKRNLHAFQLNFTLKIIQEFKKKNGINDISLIDVGDSAGNHLIKLRALDGSINSVASVNLDKKAIDKIRNKGIEAYHCRAEKLLENYNLRPNFFISYQMFEHLTNSIRFLYSIAKSSKDGETSCDRFIISVPIKNTQGSVFST